MTHVLLFKFLVLLEIFFGQIFLKFLKIFQDKSLNQIYFFNIIFEKLPKFVY